MPPFTSLNCRFPLIWSCQCAFCGGLAPLLLLASFWSIIVSGRIKFGRTLEDLHPVFQPYRWDTHVCKWNTFGTSKSLPEDPYGPLWSLKRISCRNRKESWGGHGSICPASWTAQQYLWDKHNSKNYLFMIWSAIPQGMADDFLTGCHQSPYYW